jgi:hypothetical protein
MRAPYPVPPRIGPVQFGVLGGWITVRCPRDYDSLMRNAGGQWEPGSRRWLIERRRIGPVIRTLERNVDPLFRVAGLTLG